MFTGIVEEVGTVRAVRPGRLTIAARKALEGTALGDSLSVNGACLTVTELTADIFSVDLMLETLRRSNLGSLRSGDGVNLERPLSAAGRFGGHFVQGHVDGTGRVLSVVAEGEAVVMTLAAPSDIMKYIVEKGFVAIDGVSLTVVGCDASSFAVSLVSFTRENTTLGLRRPGDLVNIEVDILAKYVERLLTKDGSAISIDFLAEHGFV